MMWKLLLGGSLLRVPEVSWLTIIITVNRTTKTSNMGPVFASVLHGKPPVGPGRGFTHKEALGYLLIRLFEPKEKISPSVAVSDLLTHFVAKRKARKRPYRSPLPVSSRVVL